MSAAVWQWAMVLTWLSWIAVYWQGGYAFVRADRQRRDPAERSRPGLLIELLIGGASLVMVAGGLLVSLGLLATPSWTRVSLQQAGFWLSLAGFVGIGVVRSVFLRRWWSAKITVHADQALIDRGPYAIVRHPLYALTLPTYAGAALVFPLWWIAVACGVAIAGYVSLARVEDAFMVAHLARYAAYRERVRFLLFPGVW